MSEQTDQAANATAQSVATNSGGNDAQEAQSKERTYTTAELERVVKERLTREQKKFHKEFEALKAKDAPAGKVSPNVEEDLRHKLSAYETEKKTLSDKLDKYRTESLRSSLERKLSENNCLDPDLVADHFLSKGLVKLEDDEIVVENATGNLDDLVKTYLDRKPHLVKATAHSGTGVKPPKPMAPGDPNHPTLPEIEAALGITDKKKAFFNK